MWHAYGPGGVTTREGVTEHRPRVGVYTHTGGETTVARIVAELLHALGVLRTGQVVETDRADLVAGYVGQTALKVHEVVDCAMGQLHLSG